MQRLLSITLISITADIVYTQEGDIREHQGPQICGGRLKGPVGIIQTPNFPNPFPVPIKCKWIIEHDIVNGTISIYFTQQYTTSGLTFTEYMYYDESYKLGERKALTVTEENITRNNWLQVQSPVLVVELTLNGLEGTQLRALGLLSVFGFNMTYMVKGPTDEPGPKSCSTIECRLLGHCYAKHDYKEFYCDCFEGYSGADCGVGPLCPNIPNICKNGGTCGQMGPAAVSCICAPGFTGDLCEAQIEAPECGIEECAEGCQAGACDCSRKDSDVSSARFDTRLQIMDQGNINISQEMIKQITNYLRACNITLHDEIEILNISNPEATGARTVWLRVWAERRDAGALRTALTRLVAMRTRTDRLYLLPATLQFDMQPALSLHALIINQRQEVWEGSEFILSCMAYGSPDITFTWYKDGVKVNFNGTTRDIWTRTVAEDALGRRMSVLGISEAKKSDSGRWSCSADDAGRRRCSALRLTILRPPDIRLVPSTLTVNKGDNVSITCLAGAGRMHSVLGFSWARERSLLPQVPGRVVWEDLYPAGSVLKLYNVQKSGEYRCQVSSMAGTNTKGVTMWTLGSKDEACESEASHGLWWPKTTPGAYASATCPPGHSGETVRFCIPKSLQHGVKWMLPDFSRCVADSLNDIYEQFKKISYGYSWGNISHVAHQYGAVLRSLPAQPGEGTLPLKHARNMLHYLLSNAGKPRDRRESVEHLLIIYDTLLKHSDTFLDEEKIYELQNALADTAAIQDSLDNLYQEFTVKTKQVREDGETHFRFISNPGSEEWLLTSAGVELMERNGNTSVVVVQYRDLTARLPSLRRTIEFNASGSKAGHEMEYQLASAQTQVTSSRNSRAAHAATTLLFVHSRNYTATECGIEECAEGCQAGACDCSRKDSDVSSARFDTRLQIMDQGNINISQEMIKQITNYLRACNITLHDEIEILNISNPEATGARTVWLRVWAERRDAGALRTALTRLVAMRTRTDRLYLLPATLQFDMQPALSLHKSGEYRCQVSSMAGTNTKGVTMWTLGSKDEACESEASHGLWWPKTTPGAYASATCPPGNSGETVRFCIPKSLQHGVKWMLPDFSRCVADSLNDIYEQFKKISYGYSWGNISHVAHQYGAVLRSLPAQPGEGTLPLKHARNMLHYLLSNAGKPRDRRESVEHLLIIYDTLLKHSDTFLDEEKIYELQNALADTAAIQDSLDNLYQEFTVKTKQVREDGETHFRFISNPGSEEWLLTSAGVELMERNGNTSVVVVQYRDLTARLPSLRRTIEFNASGSKAGHEMEYQLASAQTQVTSSRNSRAAHAATTLLFVHSRNYTATAPKLACALRTATEPSVWVTTACEVRIPDPKHVACRCRGLGTFALFAVARSILTDEEKDFRGIVKVTVGVSSSLCLAAAALQLLSLVPRRRARLPVLLKAATAGTHSVAVLTLLECDTTQEACPGALGWVCAACWCAGCAALCAQPLLLQAELAGHRQSAPSVALLAGVCTLLLLTARMSGGAPLQLGTAAQAVCAAGCAMLAVLCFALACCAALRIRTMTHKIPCKGRTYLKDRRRVVRHTLAVMATTGAVQAAGVWWVQPGPRTLVHVLLLSIAALVNGVTMLVCYVIRDEECLQSAKRVLSVPSHRDRQESPVGETSISLYIKQGGEVESRGNVGMLESTSSQFSPVTSYWRTPGLESPSRIQRRQSTPDTRADIVRCVEYKDSLLSQQRYDANVGGQHLGDSPMGPAHVITKHTVCDLIPHLHTTPQHPECIGHVCLELGILRTPPEPATSLSVDFKPYTGRHFDTSKDGCSICANSNPDVSKITSPPIKSCLKKPESDFSSSISLPSIELKEESKSKSDLKQVNKEWNKAYEAPKTDRVLNKISNDLDYLLNRTQNENMVLDQIEEAPT